MESGLKRPRGNELCRRLHPNDSRNPFSFTVAPQGVMVWRRRRIEWHEEAHLSVSSSEAKPWALYFTRMRVNAQEEKRKHGIT